MGISLWPIFSRATSGWAPVRRMRLACMIRKLRKSFPFGRPSSFATSFRCRRTFLRYVGVPVRVAKTKSAGFRRFDRFHTPVSALFMAPWPSNGTSRRLSDRLAVVNLRKVLDQYSINYFRAAGEGETSIARPLEVEDGSALQVGNRNGRSTGHGLLPDVTDPVLIPDE